MWDLTSFENHQSIHTLGIVVFLKLEIPTFALTLFKKYHFGYVLGLGLQVNI
jgi:hypothetical protein